MHYVAHVTLSALYRWRAKLVVIAHKRNIILNVCVASCDSIDKIDLKMTEQ